VAADQVLLAFDVDAIAPIAPDRPLRGVVGGVDTDEVATDLVVVGVVQFHADGVVGDGVGGATDQTLPGVPAADVIFRAALDGDPRSVVPVDDVVNEHVPGGLAVFDENPAQGVAADHVGVEGVVRRGDGVNAVTPVRDGQSGLRLPADVAALDHHVI